MMRLNLEQIAKQSGVSRSTVSRVINHDPNVSPETRARVENVIRQMNYQPNAAARSLAGGRSHVLGLVIPMGVGRIFTDPYFPLLIQGVSSACNAFNYSVMLWIAEPEYERRMMGNILNNRLIDGVILSSMMMDDPILQALIENDLPFILIGRHPSNSHVNYVDVDNLNSAREMVAYLLRLGYRRIATITGPQNMIVGVDRLQGYLSALRFWGITPDDQLIADGDFSEEGGYAAMQRLLPLRPDAVFAASDAMALGALRAITEAGLKVPQDIGLVGYDDMPFVARTNPPITTVRQPTLKVGAVATETLIGLIEQPGSGPHRIVLPTEMIIRESCRPVSNKQ
jgi:LacI family transcriptional regulator